MGSVTKTALDSIPNGAQSSSRSGQKRVLLLKPRGFCAGVVRAIDIVKIALETFGAPIYVRREIVHNRYVVNELAEKGAIFVHEIDDVPDGQRVIYSAHGVSPAVRDRSKGRGLKVIDATCPLVTKVHIEAVKFAKQGYSLVLIGHRDHDEIEGTLGEAPDVTQVVSSAAEVATLEVPDPDRVAYLTQTTLSLDEARDIIHALKQKFPISMAPTRRTSATPPRTDRSQSAMWLTTPTLCSSLVRPTAPTPTALLRFRATWVRSGISLITPRQSIQSGFRACPRWPLQPAPRRPKYSSKT